MQQMGTPVSATLSLISHSISVLFSPQVPGFPGQTHQKQGLWITFTENMAEGNVWKTLRKKHTWIER